VIDLAGGTAERAWASCERMRSLPALDWGVVGKVVVLAPHPDDETLGVGGTLSSLVGRAERIAIISLTDGERSHPSSPTHSAEQLASARASERALALAALGLGRASAFRLGLADGSLSTNMDLTQHLRQFMRGATHCLTTWHRDGHPDHDAAGLAAAQACEEYGVTLLEYPVWAWNWARPDSEDLPWSRLRRQRLSRAARRAKAKALRAYRSQTAPLSSAVGDQTVLPPGVLAHFERDYEVVFV
jgi:LmbE family N-acetylglucosaminyl deacetylase